MSVADTLHHLYEGFDPAEEGEDYALGVISSSAAIAAENARYFGEVNAARRAIHAVEWDGLLMEAVFAARAEADPNALTDRLLELAATAITYAESVQRQTDALNADAEADESEEDGE